MGISFVLAVVSGIMNSLTENSQNSAALVAAVVTVGSFVVNMLLGMGTLAIFLKAIESPEAVSFRDLWHPRPFWKYLGVSICYAIVVGIPAAPFVLGGIVMAAGTLMTGSMGLLLGATALVIFGLAIGFVLSTTFLFSMYLVIDRKLGPINALKESARITKGNRMSVFLLMLTTFGICVLGFVAFIVGLLVAIPVVSIAFSRAYRILESKAGALQTL